MKHPPRKLESQPLGQRTEKKQEPSLFGRWYSGIAMKVRVEVNGKKLAITMDSRTAMGLSLYWFLELDFRVRIRVGFSS